MRLKLEPSDLRRMTAVALSALRENLVLEKGEGIGDRLMLKQMRYWQGKKTAPSTDNACSTTASCPLPRTP